jgi:pimeloyl-ACP methyl ester carboxylesterase
MPAGTITAANLSVTLQVASGSSGPSLSAKVTAFSPLPAGSGRITFQVTGPNVAVPTPYQVSVTGTTSTGASFVSGNPAALTINPGASILSVSPSTGQQGQTLTVTITGQYTNFVQGSTSANFGAGISVGGATAGQPGTVTVSSPTTATAQITIAANATPGAQTVAVATGVQQASLAGGFTVIGMPKLLSVIPNSETQGQALNLLVTITGQYTHFAAGASQVIFGPDISVAPPTVASATVITAIITLSATATLGIRTVTVTTGNEAVSCACFTVNPPATPSISQVNPSTALQGQANLPVTITGQFTHFDMTSSHVSFGAGITVDRMRVSNATTLIANIRVDGNATLGGRTVTVTTGSEVVSLANGFTVQQGPPVITLTSPTNLSFLNISPTTVNGTVSGPSATVTINSIQAPVSNGSFSIQLPLAEGPNLVTATATSASGLVSTATIQVTLDTTPPHITITSPSDQFVATANSISVSGIVNDIVVGTVNAQQAQVTVNGVAAQVANRTFLASNIPLNPGANVIQAVAKDQAGNSATTQITVTYQAPASQPQIQLISGNNQTGVIGTLLPSPLVAALTDANNNPVANAPVIFKVLQNNGMVATGNGTPASSVVAMTNAQGQAQVHWTLGQRAGAGSDSVEAYAVGFSGTAIYTATSTLGVAGNIVIDSGNNQIVAIGQASPKPLIAVVVDSGNNRLPNVPVTFTVVQGGGSLIVPGGTNFTLNQNTSGATSVTVNTDSDGRAGVTLILGYQEGNSNNLIEANFTGNQGFPASFTASGRAEGPVANTTINGVVLDNSNVPIPGVTIRAVLTNVLNSNSSSVNAAATVQANAQGQFTIPNAPVGFVKLLVDGSTATKPGTYPTLDYDMVTIAGQNNTLQMPIYLLPLNTANQLCVTATTGGGTLTIPEEPGFSLTFGPGQVTFPGGSQSGCVSVTVVHPDRVPMQPGFGQQPRFIVTIQPAGAIFNPPAPITLPNVDGLAPRAVTEMYSFDHDIGSFVAIGTGTVSDDGQVIRSSQGVGVLKAGWHCGGNPTAIGTVADCPACAYCAAAPGPPGSGITASCVPDPGQIGASCVGAYNNPCITGVCGSTTVGGTGGVATSIPTGLCNVTPLANGTACSVGGQSGTCQGGVCVGNGNQCAPGCQSCINGTCVVQSCFGQPVGTACNMGGSSPGVCNQNQQCVGTGNQCPSGCASCTNGFCVQVCTGGNDGALCNGGGSVPGVCFNGQCQGSGNQCPASCDGSTCTNGNCNQMPTIHLTWNGQTDPTHIYIRQGTNTYSNSLLTAQVTPPGGTFTWTAAIDSIVTIQGSSDQVNIVGNTAGVSDVLASYTLPNGQTATATILVRVIYPIVLVHGFNSDPGGAWAPMSGALQALGLLAGDFNCNSPGNPANIDFCAADFCDEGMTGNQVQPSGSCPYGGSLPIWGSFSSFIDEGSALSTMIRNLRNATGASQVMILAHSMGGLASRAYLEIGGGRDVYRLITIGTPHIGTPLASMAVDSTLTQSQNVSLYLAQHLIKASSPAVQGMSESPVTADLNQLNVVFKNSLPFSTQYVSIVGQASLVDVALETAAWGALVGLECSPAPTNPVCVDLSRRNNEILGFFAASDLIVPTASQDINSVVTVPGRCLISVSPVEHSPIPATISPPETRQLGMFLQLLDLQGTNPCFP